MSETIKIVPAAAVLITLEPLGEEEGEDQEDRQPDRDDQADRVDSVHSRSTALTMRARSTNSPIVSRTNTRSATARLLLLSIAVLLPVAARRSSAADLLSAIGVAAERLRERRGRREPVSAPRPSHPPPVPDHFLDVSTDGRMVGAARWDLERSQPMAKPNAAARAITPMARGPVW
jgi:hypothetical protein